MIVNAFILICLGTSHSTHVPEELQQQKKFAQKELFDNKSTQIVSVLQQRSSQTTADPTTLLYSLYNIIIINVSQRTEKESLPQSFLEDKECQTQPEQREDKECRTQPEQREDKECQTQPEQREDKECRTQPEQPEDKECQTQPEQREDKECQTQPEQREDKECQTQPEKREDKECQTQPITEHEQRAAVAEQQKGYSRGYKILISLLFTLLLGTYTSIHILYCLTFLIHTGMGFLLISPPKMEQGNFKGKL